MEQRHIFKSFKMVHDSFFGDILFMCINCFSFHPPIINNQRNDLRMNEK